MLPAQLPHDICAFTGREHELAVLEQLLDNHNSTVLISTVDGAAGIGKTALAVRFAHHVADRFPDGQLYVNLRGFDPCQPPLPSTNALGHFLRGLGVDSRQIPNELDEQAALYRSLLAGKRTLVVLDNAATAEQVRPLFPGSSTCLTLITSRNRLGGLVARDDAKRITLRPLAADQAATLVSHVAGDHRAGAEPDAVAALARLCGYLPLALRLAAEQVAARRCSTLADLASELAVEQDRLDLLAASGDENMSLRAAFSWSYHALSPAPQRMFRLLGLHVGPDISTAAAAVLADTTPANTRRLLDALVDAHLLEQTDTSRYQLHDLLRVYARERVAIEETEPNRKAISRRLLVWYLHTAHIAASMFNARQQHEILTVADSASQPMTFSNNIEALRWYENERSNLHAAVRHAAELGEHAIAWRIAVTLSLILRAQKHWSPWLPIGQIGLASACGLKDRCGEAFALLALGAAYTDLLRLAEALDCMQQSVAIFRDSNDQLGEADCLSGLSYLHWRYERFDEAIGYSQQVLKIALAIDDRERVHVALNNIGEISRLMGNYNMARDYLEQAVADFPEGNSVITAKVLNNLGASYRGLGQVDKAMDCIRRALAMNQEIEDRWSIAFSLRNLGDVLLDTNRDTEACEAWTESLAILEEFGDPTAADVRAKLTVVDDDRRGDIRL